MNIDTYFDREPEYVWDTGQLVIMVAILSQKQKINCENKQLFVNVINITPGVLYGAHLSNST